MMSRMIPNSSKYPPRPIVPNGSLKVTITLAMLFLFHIGCRTVLANLIRERRERGRGEGEEGEREREEGGGRRGDGMGRKRRMGG